VPTSKITSVILSVLLATGVFASGITVGSVTVPTSGSTQATAIAPKSSKASPRHVTAYTTAPVKKTVATTPKTTAPIPLSIKVTTVKTSALSLPANVEFYVAFTVPAYGSGTTAVLQKLDDNGAWQARKTIAIPSTKTHTTNLHFTVTRDDMKTSGKASYRVATFSTSTKFTPAVTKGYTISYAPVKSGFNHLNLAAKSSHKATEWLSMRGNTNTPAAHRLVYLQQYNPKTKAWDTVNQAYQDEKTGAFKIVLVPEDTPSVTYRYYLAPVELFSEAYSYNIKVLRTSNAVSIKPNSMNTSNQVAPWVSQKISWEVNVPKNTKVKVQRQTGKTWKTVANTKVNSDLYVTFNSEKGTTSSVNQKLVYRLYVPKSGVGWKDTAGGNQAVQWINPNKYTGMAKTVHDYIKAQCPATLITIQNSKMSGGEEWGLTQLDANRTTIYAGVPSQHLRTVSLHECGHVRQWKLYSGSWDYFVKKMNSVYGQSGTLGIEQNADCIANAWHTNSYFAYGGNCNGTKGSVARSMASGKKF
jgi:hypothetical protein